MTLKEHKCSNSCPCFCSKCRTTDPQASYQLQEALEIKHKFQYSEVYPSSKVRHFNQ